MTRSSVPPAVIPGQSAATDIFIPAVAQGQAALDATLRQVADLAGTTAATRPPNAYERFAREESFYKENPLNQFEQTTYNFRLFMTNDEDILIGGNGSLDALLGELNRRTQVTIAQSGVTGFNITNVSMRTLAGPGRQNRNVDLTELTITIKEPMGTSFLDKIYQGAEQLGVRNFAKMWYYLELEFTGYDQLGNRFQNVLSGGALPNGGRWVWQIHILKIETSLDATGGTYVLTCIPMNESAFQADYATTPVMYSIAAGTVSEFLQEFAKALNATYAERYGTANHLKYDFFAHPITRMDNISEDLRDPNRYRLVADDPEKSNVRNIQLRRSEGGGKPVASIPRGSNIAQVIEHILMSTEQGQRLAADVEKAGDLDRQPAGQRPRRPTIFRVEANVNVKDYSYLLNQYVMEIGFHITPYRTQYPVLSPIDEKMFIDNPEKQQQIYNELKNAGFLQKRYDYMFTGRNTEITSLDIKYDLMWSYYMPHLQGYRASYDATAPMQRYNDGAFLENDFIRQQSALQERRDDLIGERDKISTRLNTQTGSPSARDLLRIDEITLLIEQTTGRISDLGRLRDEQRERNVGIVASQEQIRRARATLANNIYAEAIIPNAGMERPLPISGRQGGTGSRNQAGYGLLSQYHPGKSIYGALLDQLYDSTAMQEITMEIRGDPYWLGESNLERRLSLARFEIGRQETTLPPTAPIRVRDGDIYFLLTFRYPNELNDDGAPVLRRQDVFTGIYKAVSIDTTFADGEFKQTLTAFRVPHFDILRILGVNDAKPSPVATGRVIGTQIAI